MENNVVDWNDNFVDLFTGFDYSVTITVVNEGSGTLHIEDISSGDDVFRSEPAALEIPPFDEADVNFIMHTEQNGRYEGEMTFTSDDPNEGGVGISLVGETFSPPIIVIDPESVSDALLTGEVSEWILDLANDGGSDLRWETDIEIVQEPGRDENSRSLRSVDGKAAGPVRDDLGEELGRFQWNRAGQQNYKAGIAFDPDNELMLITTYSPNWMAVVDPENDYEIVREW